MVISFQPKFHTHHPSHGHGQCSFLVVAVFYLKPLAMACNLNIIFAGPSCTHRVDTCACNNQCSAYGECRDSVDGAVCICQPGWTGERCEIPMRTCEYANSCAWYEECVNVGNGHTCQCPHCYTGPTCSDKVQR